MLLHLWQYLYNNFFRFWIKWILKQVTRKCELQRIFDSLNPGAPRTHRVEYALKCSKSKVLRRAINVDVDDLDKCLMDIMKVKKIHVQKDPRFKLSLRVCVLQISGYKQLYLCVENLRKQPYDSNNEDHEEQLTELWNLLMPNQALKSRITKQWGDIGFQGDDPKTDFRGMGMLGLVNLVYFSKHYTEESRQILSRSNHPKMGFSYAIVGINLTEMAYSLLRSDALKSHLYNLIPGVPQLEHFHQFYCYLMYEFDKFWFQEEPESIMLFNQYREKFQNRIKGLLINQNVMFTLRKANSL
uniref:ELMO domain-containing protein 2 isoform X2 n=1 Tax=Geotrypetes seraphini TaxID=260995 RepID=A0A6P8R9G8_GEOSA|nr:ELMO domain-containing protein 2 isoform X2 [Geotrypetes seraphini]XP_033795601.1 ELMO domain-containing protein 2 isoform X2 [Geotrypetes seraphini]XP_033795611.1 ELMO domain-containing protein 2 isoform X2 [Geotrypetes seraphini]